MATRRELDLLRDEVKRIDDHGSRGVGVIQSQLTDLVKDMTELKSEVNTRFEGHQREHDRESRDRMAARRWLIGIGISGVLAATAVGTLLFEIMQKLH